jgi:predicted AlkP superfamily pyrophosphatase or phosphodiesterase
MALLDSYVKRIVDTLQEEVLMHRATVIVVSDHGFRQIKHKLHPNVLLRQGGLITGDLKHTLGDAWVASTGGTAMVYVSDPTRKEELVPRLRMIFANREGIDRVYGPDSFVELGLPLASASDQGPDLVLSALPDYSFGNEAEGSYVTGIEGGTHGYLNTDPKMQAIFVAWGAGIASGVRLDKISNLDVAPTIAAILN